MARIDFLIDSMAVGGTQRHLALLLPALKERGHDVRLWCYHGGNEFRYELAAAGVPVVSGRRMASWFLKECLFGQVRIVHSFMMRDSLWEVVAGRMCGATVIRSTRNTGHWRTGSRLESLKVSLRRRLVHHFHANSEGVRDYLISGEGVPESEITVIENATADLRHALPRFTRSGIGLQDSGFVMVAVERLIGRKNTGFLIDAVARLRDQEGLEVSLLLVGDGAHRGRLQERARNLGLGPEACVFVGASSIPHAYLREADLFVNASKAGSEGFSNSLLEAVMMGKPCVVSEGNRCGVVREGDNGLYFDPESPGGMEDFCAAIAGLRANSKRRDAMGKTSREIYESAYPLDRQTDEYMAFYKRISRV